MKKSFLHLAIICFWMVTSPMVRGNDYPLPSHPCPVAADLWVLGGQSNMQGNGIPPVTETHPDPRILMFGMDNRWREARDPLHRKFEAADPIHEQIFIRQGETHEAYQRQRARSLKEPIGGVGPALAFARHLAENTSRSIGLIPCAHDGSSMAMWDPALKDKGGESLYGSMLGRIGMVGGKIKGVLWYQGESDTLGGDEKLYEQRLLDFVDSLRRDTGQPGLPFIYVQLGRFYYGDPANAHAWEKVREIQRRAARRRENMFVVSAIDLPMDDLAHISFAGQQRLGRRLAEVALSQVYRRPGHASPIDLESVKVENFEESKPWTEKKLPMARIYLHFSGVNGRLQAAGRPADFELRAARPGKDLPVIYRADFDPRDPAGLILRVFGAITQPMQLIYGAWMHPYLNIVDDKDIPIPAFGPLDLPLGVIK